MTASSPSGPTMTLPTRRSPWISASADGGGRLRHQPVVGRFEGRAAVVDPAVLVPHRIERIGSLGVGQLRRDRWRADRRGSGRGRPRAPRRASANAVVAEDAAGDRLAGHAPHHEAGRAEQPSRRRRRAPRARGARHARHARIASASRRMTPGALGRPGGSRRRMSSSPLAVNAHVSRDAPPVRRRSPLISTGAPSTGATAAASRSGVRRRCRRGRHRRPGRGTRRARRP